MWKPESHQRSLDNAIEKVQNMEERRIRYRLDRSPPTRDRRQRSPPQEYEVVLDPKTCRFIITYNHNCSSVS